MRLTLPWLVALAVAASAGAARLPFRHYTSADGLAQDSVTRMAADGEGFLWVGTRGGLSRFDGERFETFGPADGLEGDAVLDVVVGADGTDYVATDAGLFAFRPAAPAPPGALFRRVPIPEMDADDRPHRLLLRPDGTLWVGSFRDVFRVTVRDDVPTTQTIDLGLKSRVQSMAADPSGTIWVGTHASGIYRIGLDGAVDHLPASVPGADFVRGFRFEPDGHVWTSFFGGIAIFEPPVFGPSPRVRVLGHEEGMPIDTKGFVDDGPDSVLVGTSRGIAELRRDGPGSPWRVGPTIDRRGGLPGDNVESLARDASGNLWVGLNARGLAKRLAGGFTTLDEPAGPGAVLVQLSDDAEGRPLAVSFVGGKEIVVSRPDRDGEPSIRVSLPESVRYTGWGATRKILRTRGGEWWVGTGSGVFRYGGADGSAARLGRPPDARFTVRDGLAGDEVFSLHEDSRGDVWVSAEPDRAGPSSLAVRAASGGPFVSLPASDVGTSALAYQFADGPDGSTWIAFLDGTLVRERDRAFETVPLPSEFDSVQPRLYFDDGGTLWLLGRGVLYRGTAAGGGFERYDARSDISGSGFYCAVEDRLGRLWVAGSLGLYRVDPVGREERRFTVDDGLVGNAISLCHRDGGGVLWFSDYAGLSRLDPGPERPASLAPARLRDVKFSGEAVPLPSSGVREAGPVEVAPGKGRLAVEFFAVHLGPGPAPRFQYRLEGVDPEWSAPTRDRRVQYATLSPGTYRFEVRSVDEEGTPHPTPAAVTFEVLAPFWERGWFLALAALVVAAAVHTGYRLRLARVVALERVRTRIATDLHDDIGSSLSQISILSQLARREIERTGPAPGALSRITELSGELVDTLGDVVWAINPQRDRLSDLIHRMRRFAGELFAEGKVSLRLDLPEGGEDQPLDADVRRQVYLVFKEALHNVLRHSGATHVEVALRREAGGLSMRVRDDGRGIDSETSGSGHGLASMRRRAAALGAGLEIRSAPGGGTEILLRAGPRPRRGKPSTWIVGRPGTPS